MVPQLPFVVIIQLSKPLLFSRADLTSSHIRTDKSHTMSTAELASSYAALILADDGIEITVSASIPSRLFSFAGGAEPKILCPARKATYTVGNFVC